MALHGPHSYISPQGFSLLGDIARADIETKGRDPDLLRELEQRGLIVVYEDPPRTGRYAGLTQDGWRRLRAEKPAPRAAGWELDLRVAELVCGSARRIETWAKGFVVHVDHEPSFAQTLGIAQSATVKTAPGVGSPPLFQPSRDGGLALALLEAAGPRLGVQGIDLSLQPHPTILLRYAVTGDPDPRYVSADGSSSQLAICTALIKAVRRMRRGDGY